MEKHHFKAQNMQVPLLMAFSVLCVDTCVLQFVCRTTNTDKALFF